MRPEPEFDPDGYPTDSTLEHIRTWDYADLGGLLDFIAEAWNMPYAVSRELSDAEAEIVNADEGDRHLRLATVGWSGNESLIHAFEDNRMAWFMTWRLSTRGGLYIFQYPNWILTSTDGKE